MSGGIDEYPKSAIARGSTDEGDVEDVRVTKDGEPVVRDMTIEGLLVQILKELQAVRMLLTHEAEGDFDELLD